MKSRWQEELEAHPFQPKWKEAVELANSLEVDPTEETSYTEYKRLSRAIKYLDEMIAAVDAELVPRSLWANIDALLPGLSQNLRIYQSNRAIPNLKEANNIVDQLLSLLRPFVILPQQYLRAIGEAQHEYQVRLRALADDLRFELHDSKNKIANLNRVADTETQRLNAYLAEATVTTKTLNELLIDAEGAESRVALAVKTIEEAEAAVMQYKLTLLGRQGSEGLAGEISTAYEELEEKVQDADQQIAALRTRLSPLLEVADEVLGPKSPESGTREGGLVSKLNERMLALESMEKAETIRRQELSRQIEELLPGAKSAGLSHAFKSLSSELEAPVETYTKVFALAIGLLFLLGLMSIVKEFTLWPFAYELALPDTFEQAARSWIFKAPVLLPVIWLAIFAARRRAQYERLRQEYLHKKALTSSYEGFRQQIAALGDGGPILSELIRKAVDALAHNASSTLDGRAQEDAPIADLLKKVGPEELKKVLDVLKDAVEKSKKSTSNA